MTDYTTALAAHRDDRPDLADNVDTVARDTILTTRVHRRACHRTRLSRSPTRSRGRCTVPLIHTFGKVPGRRDIPEIKLLDAALADIDSTDPRRTGPSPASLLDVAIALAQRAPLLLVVDEFGKNLEAAQQRPDADLYLLQLLAEAAQTERGAPIVLVTMQHLAFGDYAAAADTAQQREWAKIQGRFEDVVFVDAPAQTRQLITSVFTHDRPTRRSASRKWASERGDGNAQTSSFSSSRTPNCSRPAIRCIPATLAVLPELCRRYGQNERSLFGFLAGNDPTSVPQILKQRLDPEPGPAPDRRTRDVYNYFATTGQCSNSAHFTVGRDHRQAPRRRRPSDRADRLAKIRRGPQPRRQQRPATGVTGSARASVDIERNQASRSHSSTQTSSCTATRPTSIGSGTAVTSTSSRHLDIAPNPAAASTPSHSRPQPRPLDPAIAAGHSMRTDTLRTFDRRYLRRRR